MCARVSRKTAGRAVATSLVVQLSFLARLEGIPLVYAGVKPICLAFELIIHIINIA